MALFEIFCLLPYPFVHRAVYNWKSGASEVPIAISDSKSLFLYPQQVLAVPCTWTAHGHKSFAIVQCHTLGLLCVVIYLALSVACWQMDPGSAVRFWLHSLLRIWNRANVYLFPIFFRWLLNTGFGDSSSSSDWYSGCISVVNSRKSKNLSSLDFYFSFFIIGSCVCVLIVTAIYVQLIGSCVHF